MKTDPKLDTLGDIHNAKKLLKKHGYFIENLWHIYDVKYINDDQILNTCSDSKAYDILNTVLTSEHVIELINNKIRFEVYQE